ncbi:MAG: hypothetical protein AB7G12_03730 [Thermoanaerobaculia bacterium]
MDDPFAIAPELGAAPRLDDDALLVIAWDVALDGAATPAGAHAIAATGATPLLRLRFTTPSPLLEHTDSLQRELEAAAELARLAPATTRFEIVWSGAPGAPAAPPAKEYGYLFKRAAVAIGGANSGAGIYPQPLVSDSSWLEAWYAEEVAAYLDGVTLAPADPATLADVLAFVSTLDPGRPIVVDGEPWPGDSRRALVAAARSAAAGADLTIFAEPAAAADGSTTALGSLAPLKILANEFQGDLSLDPYSRPTGAAEAWSFVRGEDLALRVIAAPAAGENELSLTFADTQLKSPAAVNLTNGEIVSLGGSRPTGQPMQLALRKTGPAVLLQIERVAADELDGGVAEKLLVASERQIPVEEILARLQSSEDRQARRLRHYQAVNRTSLRFQAASGVQTLEASFEGAFFSRQGEEPDWAWQTFFINGIRWRGKEIPEIPLIQPEKAASMPLEILFTKEYRYSLRGTEVVEGRDCWVVDFAPSVPVEGRALYRGTVWIDRELFVRVRSRAAQLGLTGEILSNEETIDYSPIDEAGAASAWNLESYYLPLRVRAQQILSVLNTATVIEKEVVLTDVILNGPDFDRQREDLLASDATMVRDTAQGLRYLVKDEAGGRVVKEGFDTSKLFLLGGAFYDDSLDYPLPLVGLNYFDINFRGGDRQLNAFFGGVLGIVNFADPRIGESKFDLGTDLFAFAISTSDQLYRNEVESVDEEIENRPARVNINAGHPLGSYGKITATYQLAYDHYGRSDNTAPDFVLPESGLTHRLGLQYAFARSGYRLALEGSYHQRQNWSFWGLPGNTDFDPDQKEYSTWQVSLSKSWYLAKFRKFGVELNYSGGRNLDRFSKYQFGIFGGNRVHGYQIGKVRAEELYAAHLSYGFELGELLRIDGLLDAAWATDETSGLDNELLSGVGISGTFLGPWNTLVNLDVGTPIAGPDDGISVYLVFLKLFQ